MGHFDKRQSFWVVGVWTQIFSLNLTQKILRNIRSPLTENMHSQLFFGDFFCEWILLNKREMYTRWRELWMSILNRWALSRYISVRHLTVPMAPCKNLFHNCQWYYDREIEWFKNGLHGQEEKVLHQTKLILIIYFFLYLVIFTQIV